MFLICSASRICSFCLLFWCSNIVFSERIFRNSTVGQLMFFKCCAMELVSERCFIYELSKPIEQLISPYLPCKYTMKCTNELIQVRDTIKLNNGILTSLDVENIFTNVPVNVTVDIIINNIYNNLSLPPLKINLNILRKLLLTCTTKVWFMTIL